MNNSERKRGVELHYDTPIKVVSEMEDVSKRLGVGVAWAYYDDPKHLLFTLARYKFAAKLFNGRSNLLEIGCGDGFATRILLQAVKRVVGIDIDERFILDARSRTSEKWPVDFRVHDIIQSGSVQESFDAILSLDVMEHIDKADHDIFVENIIGSMSSDGALIIGMPSLESQPYASKQSQLGHVACLTQEELFMTMKRHFTNVFLFSMNDEVVHTGYARMSHYNLALCCQPLETKR